MVEKYLNSLHMTKLMVTYEMSGSNFIMFGKNVGTLFKAPPLIYVLIILYCTAQFCDEEISTDLALS